MLGWARFLIVHGADSRRRILLLGIGKAEDRARLLRLGFGDVLGHCPDLDEVEARAERLGTLAEMLPRYRQIGSLRLDLLARDGFTHGRALGLHPREFDLLWRLADTPGFTVRKPALVEDVWRLGFIPETNSLAVHVSRLREKLKLAGLPGLVETAPSGGYRLADAVSAQ